MSRARLAIVGVTLLSLLAFAHEAGAGVIDFIWDMSGPQMFGVGIFGCKVDLISKKGECRVVDHKLGASNLAAFAQRTIWFAFETNVYVSGTKDSGPDTYDFFKTGMIALEPVVEWRPGTQKWLYLGGGATVNQLFGQNAITSNTFPTFTKAGLKFPVGVVFPLKGQMLDVAFDLRLYPRQFKSDQFGFAARAEDASNRWEPVFGLNFGLSW